MIRQRGAGPTLHLLARRNAELETGLSSSVRLLKERIALLIRLLAQSKGNEATSRYLSTELSALRGELRSVEELLSESKMKRLAVVGFHPPGLTR
ncbi:MAG: hypothetical protein H0X01_08450 [Nitrospira sp.]|nr:hypothetical protein [Nitrospira sp.]